MQGCRRPAHHAKTPGQNLRAALILGRHISDHRVERRVEACGLLPGSLLLGHDQKHGQSRYRRNLVNVDPRLVKCEYARPAPTAVTRRVPANQAAPPVHNCTWSHPAHSPTSVIAIAMSKAARPFTVSYSPGSRRVRDTA